MPSTENLITEQQNPASQHIDEISSLELVKIINEEDKKIALAVEKVLPDIARAIDTIVAHMKEGGRLFYTGAGTSGRLGILDASECPPTYGTDPELVQGMIAGGLEAIFRAKEGAEDSEILGQQDLQGKALTASDIVVGIAASGRTPYVVGALNYAASLGAATIAISCAPESPIARAAKISIAVITGPEIVTGSTRMKAGTAQKMVLNMLSTGSMIRLGKVYGNLMVDVHASNKKLEERSVRIVMAATSCSQAEASRRLQDADGQAKLAIFLILSGLDAKTARQLLQKHHGFLRQALADPSLKEETR